jgi:hypothetical protein
MWATANWSRMRLLLAKLHRFRLCWPLSLLVTSWTLSTWVLHQHDIVSRALATANPVPEVHQRTSKQYVRYNKRGTKLVMKTIHTVHRDDLKDLSDDIFAPWQGSSSTTSRHDKKEVLELLKEAGITEVDDETVALLPTWKEVTDLYGNMSADQPIYTAGLETCQRFRDSVSPENAFLGTAGMFNSGTNAMTYYLRANLKMDSVGARPKNHHDGILTQVPWDKHYFASLKHNHTAKHSEAYTKNHVLPIVVIRDPLTWMQSMCATPYMVQPLFRASGGGDDARLSCPHLTTDTATTTTHTVSMPTMTERTWSTLLHLWNDWYREYLHEYKEPFLMVRFEDLLFRPRTVLNVVRQCAGAVWAEEDAFTYIVDQSKWEHARFYGPQSTMLSAMIKHGNAARRVKGMTEVDVQIARNVLDKELMQIFGYQYPVL